MQPQVDANWFPKLRRLFGHITAFLAISLVAGCATTPPNASGLATTNYNPGVAGPIKGIGIEGQDIISMSDQMMRDMLSEPRLVNANKGKSPRVIIDSQYFSNDSSQPINRNIITDRLRVSLNRASQGKMTFIGRQYASAVQIERDLKRNGITDVGTTGMTKATLGSDYRLGGRINSLDQKSPSTGMIQRYTQITFEMFDVESGEIIWSGMYEFARAAADDVMYR
jgi:PBP1b-binding outer membrane lipoprotein LpoB